jgi:AGZA family xanthine/uracil permease-like MFS transporter
VAPLAGLVPAAATAPALILVGALMVGALGEVEWDNPLDAVPAFLTVVMIPLTFSIANGLAFGITSYAVLKLVTGKASRADWMLMVLAALFVLRFAYLAAA